MLCRAISKKRNKCGIPLASKRVWMRDVIEEHSDAILDERTTTQTDPFQSDPLGRGQLADFRHCSLHTYRSRYARRSRLENRPTARRRDASYLLTRCTRS